jgi:hypothetical protein
VGSVLALQRMADVCQRGPAPAFMRQVRKNAKSAQQLVQLQPFLAVFLLECMGQLAYFGPT